MLLTAARREIVAAGVALLVAVASSLSLEAQSPSAEGRWRTIDDQTGEAKSIVVISREGNSYVGRIERVFAPPAPSTNPLCEKCDGELKNKPIVGMRVIWGFRLDGDRYKDGRLLDPESGNVYKGTLRVVDGGRSLQVRGYVALPMLGRTQTWKREN